jgi:hypothetical protein
MSALPRTASFGARTVVADSRHLRPTQLSRHDWAGFSEYQLRDPE